jgi:hypothetical protein
VVLGRGAKDYSCLSEISSSIEHVMSDESISDNKKSTFVSKVQNVIDIADRWGLDRNGESLLGN